MSFGRLAEGCQHGSHECWRRSCAASVSRLFRNVVHVHKIKKRTFTGILVR